MRNLSNETYNKGQVTRHNNLCVLTLAVVLALEKWTYLGIQMVEE